MRELAVGVSIMMLLLLVAAPAIGQDRPIVAVFDVEAKGVQLPKATWDRLSDYLGSLLAQRGYQVIPRSQLKERLVQQKKTSYQQCYDQACQLEIGKELAANKSVSSQVLKLGKKCKVTLTFYDLGKAASEGAAVASGGCDEDGIVESLEVATNQLLSSGPGSTSPALPPKAATAPPAPPVQQPAPMPQPAPPVEKAGLTWIKSVPAGIYFTKSEITVAQYRTCVEAGKCTPAHFDDGTCEVWDGKAWVQEKLPASFRGDDQPVVCVDWGQADVYCTWAGGRVPTDEEWYEEASNGKKRKYPWGNEKPTCDYAVMAMVQEGFGCGRNSTWSVCSKERGNSVSGLCDMGGNVWEWTSTSGGSARVVRGGGWYDFGPFWFSDPVPVGGDDSTRHETYGFRCGR